jgi:hypothetical protein
VARAEWTLKIDWPEQRWWSDPELVVTAFEKGIPYAVAVELRRDDDGVPFVTGVAARRHLWADGWKGERTHVSPREVQRLPLAKIIRAALAAAATAEPPDPRDRDWQPVPGVPNRQSKPALDPGEVAYDPGDDPRWHDSGPEWARDARKILIPRGRPTRGTSAAFYKELADSHRNFSARGESPVKAIARRKRVSENTVHQWVHRARALGFLEPSPRSQRPPQV